MIQMKYLLGLFLGLMLSINGISQSYTIGGKVNGLSNATIYLANYYGNKLYYNDTTTCDANGEYFFEGKPFEECGKYAIVMPGPKYFDILVAEEDIYIISDTSNAIEKIDVKKSVNNQVYFDYISFINLKRAERMPLEKMLGDSATSEKMKENLIEQLRELNEEVIDKQRKIVEEHPDELVGKFIKMSMKVDVPDEIKDSEDANLRYHWYIDHYWDNYDLTDPRLVRDQMFHKSLEEFFTSSVIQVPDTLFAEATSFISRMGDNEEMVKYSVHYVTHMGETSKIMCMDRLFVLMVDEYYKTGKAVWMEDAKLAEIIEAADKKRPTLCGEKAPNIILPDTTDVNWVSLYDVDAEYTILMIWESSCGHCKKEMPKLKELYAKWRDKNVEVFAIGNDFENEDWKKFIREKEIGNWINVSDNPQINAADSARVLIVRDKITTIESLNFRTTYDVFSTPKLYLLDKDKVILGKQLASEQLDEMLTRYFKTEEVPKDESMKEESSSEPIKDKKKKDKAKKP